MQKPFYRSTTSRIEAGATAGSAASVLAVIAWLRAAGFPLWEPSYDPVIAPVIMSVLTVLLSRIAAGILKK